MSNEHLSDQQIARVEALEAAQPLLGRNNRGLMQGSEPTELNDLVDLAVFILDGKHPMEDPIARMSLEGQSLAGVLVTDEKEGDERDDTPHA